MTQQAFNKLASAILVTICATLVVGFLFGAPLYNRWSRGIKGQAELRYAEYQKQVLVETARAEVDAAELQARAIQIVGQAAKDFPEWRHQNFVQAFSEAIQTGQVDLVFVPTEANVPIIMPIEKEED